MSGVLDVLGDVLGGIGDFIGDAIDAIGVVLEEIWKDPFGFIVDVTIRSIKMFISQPWRLGSIGTILATFGEAALREAAERYIDALIEEWLGDWLPDFERQMDKFGKGFSDAYGPAALEVAGQASGNQPTPKAIGLDDPIAPRETGDLLRAYGQLIDEASDKMVEQAEIARRAREAEEEAYRQQIEAGTWGGQ